MTTVNRVNFCTDCEYPIAGEVSSVDELPRSWRPPFGAWIPNGPRTYFRVCDVCDSAWAIRGDPELGTLDARLLPADAIELFDDGTPLSGHLRALTDPDPLRRSALRDLLDARLEHGDAQSGLAEFLGWFAADVPDARTLRDALQHFGRLLSRISTDPHLEASRAERPGSKRELFGARIDQGMGLAEAARLAQRDWVRSNKVISLPSVRGVDVGPMLELLDTPPEASSDAEATHLVRELESTLSVIAVAALGNPIRLTVTAASRDALERFLPD